MANIFFLRIELLLMVVSGGYIFYFVGNYFYSVYSNVKQIVSPKREQKVEEVPVSNQNTVIIEKDSLRPQKTQIEKGKGLSEEDKNRLLEILKKVRVNTSKSYYEAAKSLIVEGLAIDKLNKELNMELAGIYEAERNYKNAEYIYKDLVDLHNENYEILKKLGYILALQKRYDEAIEIYEDAFSRNKGDMDVIDILTDLHYEIGSYPAAYKYVVMSLKEKPRNIDRLILRAELSLREGKEDEAIVAYRHVLEMQPYNTQAIDGLRSLGQKIK